MKRIYPDTLDRFEIESGRSDQHWQIYSVTDGMGGSGIGDIAGRIVQELLIQSVSELGISDIVDFDFADFAEKYLQAVKIRVRERLARYKTIKAGCSLAFVLINGKHAYTFSLGTNRIYLIRDHSIHRITEDHVLPDQAKPSLFIGNTIPFEQIVPQNLNKLSLQENDCILLISDGIYQVLSDQEILELIESDNSFVKSVQNFETKFSEKEQFDDYTILGLKVKKVEDNISSIVETPLSSTIDETGLTPGSEADSAYDHFSPLYDDYPTDPDALGTINYPMEKKQPSKFMQGLILFLQCFGIGLIIGVLLMLLFWIFYIGI